MEKKKDINATPLSRKKAAQERKKEKKRELDRAYYLQNCEKKIAQFVEHRRAKGELSKRPARTRTETKKTERKEKVKKQ